MITADVVLSLSAVVVIAKFCSHIPSWIWLYKRSPDLIADCKEALAAKEYPNFRLIEASHSRPRRIHALVLRRPGRLRSMIDTLSTTPPLVMIAAVLLFALRGRASVWTVDLAASGLVALCFIMAATALWLRLVLGSYDTFFSDIQVPSRFKGFGIAADRANTLAVYFLVLLGTLLVGFAGAYAAFSAVHPEAFAATTRGGGGPILWLLQSAETLATVGQPGPSVGWARLVVLVQLATGPLLLTWLASAIVGGAPNRDEEVPSRSDHAL